MQLKRWRPVRRRSTTEERRFVEEAELFLRGEYAEHLLDEGCTVPEWAWLSLLTHTPGDILAERVAGLLTSGKSDGVAVLWQAAVSLLAQEMVNTAERRDCSIASLQRALTVELETGGGPSPTVAIMGPVRFIQDVRSVLACCRGNCDP